MFPPRWFLPYDALFQLITAFVALAVALYAMKGHQLIKDSTLQKIFLAFLLLAVGLFINGITLSYTYALGISFTAPSDPLSIADVGFWAYYGMSMLAYSFLIFAYASRLRESTVALGGGVMGAGGNGGGAGGGGGMWGGGNGSTLLTLGPLMELILVILLLAIVIAQFAHLVVKRSRYSIMVTFSFLLLLISHILIMFSPVEDIIYVFGRVFELSGFISLFAVLYGLRRGG
ncbi:MAG: hypothetical protein SA339_08495 [Methanomassiliicoccus sp.]|nr:hypothetical protein [Methanomassiliicoccus sp.]